MYRIARAFLFKLDPETAHGLSLTLLDWAYRLGLLRLFLPKVASRPVNVMGIDFPNQIGLAAGLDKNGDHIDALSACGFGFVEIGTVTPEPQPGNDRPRLFRLVEHQAIINRMGFNNLGVKHLVEQVRRSHRRSIIGINIGKNKLTPNEQALDDYLICFRQVYDYADYITVNISSPNTPGLRELQQGDELSKLLAGLQQEKVKLMEASGRDVPVAVKIAPDLVDEEVDEIALIIKQHNIDAVIATNTTNDKSGVADSSYSNEAGGLSGRPLKRRADHVLRRLVKRLDGAVPVIAVGGIMQASDAVEKIEAGAALVQIYTGFVYAGPALVRQITRALNKP